MSKYAKEVNKYLSRMQNGDLSQIEGLYELTANHLREVVNAYIKNEADCDDVVIETFLRVKQYIHSFNPKQDGYNWMCTIARNLVRMFNKKEVEVQYLGELKGDEIATDSFIEQTDTKIDLFLATQNLDETNKAIFHKRFYMGETLDEIARELGMTKAAVYKRLKRIAKEIEKHYKNG